MNHAQDLKKITRLAIFYIFLFGLYTNLPITIFGKPLFGAFAIIAGLSLLFLNLPKNIALFKAMAGLAALLIINVALSPKGLSPDKVTSSIQLFLSVLAATGAFLELRKWRPRSIERTLLVGMMLIILFGFIEVYLGMSQTFSAIRDMLFNEQDAFIYSSIYRDIELHGGIRPTIFTQEPSHPAKFIGVFLACYYIISNSRYKTVLFFILLVSSLAIIRSPTILLAVPIALYIKATGAESQRFSKKGWMLIIIGAVAFFTIPSWVGYLPFERARSIAAGEDASAIIRLFGPLKISFDILLNYPLFGVGIGGTETAKPFLLNIYSNFDAIRMERFDIDESAGWGSALFQGIAFSGILGSLLFAFALKKHLQSIALYDHILILFVFLIVFSADGAFVIIRPWAYFFIIMAVHYAQSQQRRITKPL